MFMQVFFNIINFVFKHKYYNKKNYDKNTYHKIFAHTYKIYLLIGIQTTKLNILRKKYIYNFFVLTISVWDYLNFWLLLNVAKMDMVLLKWKTKTPKTKIKD